MTRARLLRSAISVLIGFAIAGLLAEGLARLFFDERIAPRYVMDSGYGVRANQPNITTRHYVPGEYSVTISTNSAGMRATAEYSVEKPDGVNRILMLGDSFVFGYGVENDEVVSAMLESLLNGETAVDREFEVINLAVAGFGQAEELVSYEENGKAYGADVVVVFYYENDIGNNAVSGLFEIAADGTLVRIGKSYLPAVRSREILYSIAPVRWLFEHSAAWNVIRNRLSYIVQQSKLKEQGLTNVHDSNSEATDLTKALLRKFIAEIRANGSEPVIVVIPSQKQMASNFPLERQDIEGLGAYLIDGRDYLVAEDYWPIDSHWKATGHRKTAEQLVSLIEGIR